MPSRCARPVPYPYQSQTGARGMAKATTSTPTASYAVYARPRDGSGGKVRLGTASELVEPLLQQPPLGLDERIVGIARDENRITDGEHHAREGQRDDQAIPTAQALAAI